MYALVGCYGHPSAKALVQYNYIFSADSVPGISTVVVSISTVGYIL